MTGHSIGNTFNSIFISTFARLMIEDGFSLDRDEVVSNGAVHLFVVSYVDNRNLKISGTYTDYEMMVNVELSFNDRDRYDLAFIDRLYSGEDQRGTFATSVQQIRQSVDVYKKYYERYRSLLRDDYLDLGRRLKDAAASFDLSYKQGIILREIADSWQNKDYENVVGLYRDLTLQKYSFRKVDTLRLKYAEKKIDVDLYHLK